MAYTEKEAEIQKKQNKIKKFKIIHEARNSKQLKSFRKPKQLSLEHKKKLIRAKRKSATTMKIFIPNVCGMNKRKTQLKA